MSILWPNISREFERDGALRDIHVSPATAAEWQRILDFLLEHSTGLNFSIDGEPAPLPALAAEIFPIRDHAAALLTFSFGGILFAAHFFTELEVEFDFEPTDVHGQEELDSLLSFMQQIGDLLAQPIFVTGENGLASAFLGYWPRSREFFQYKTDPDLAYAQTREGHTLPVIDVTDPRFTVADDPQSLSELIAASTREETQRRSVPKFIMRLMLKWLTKKSLLARALFATDATFLDGLSTYVMKLGPAHLPPPYDSPADKRFAGSAHLTLLRLRTQQTARLLADGLATDLSAAAPGTPLYLINIAGGPAIDSLNALILLQRENPGLLQRPIAIHVLDRDEAGPFFGANALAAFRAEGRPLAGLEITFQHLPYDWNQSAPLKKLLVDLTTSPAIIAASSEGGLFEYGSDDAIIANLQALHAGGVRLVAGSVTKDDEARRRMIVVSKFKLVPRGLHGIAPLAHRGGYTMAQAAPTHFSDQIALRPLETISSAATN
jgi:hypothetical protein